MRGPSLDSPTFYLESEALRYRRSTAQLLIVAESPGSGTIKSITPLSPAVNVGRPNFDLDLLGQNFFLRSTRAFPNVGALNPTILKLDPVSGRNRNPAATWWLCKAHVGALG